MQKYVVIIIVISSINNDDCICCCIECWRHCGGCNLSLRTVLRTHQLLESRLVDVTLQCEVTQDFPRRLVTLHLHLVCLQTTVVSLWTGCHHWSSCHPLDVLQMATNLLVVNKGKFSSI